MSQLVEKDVFCVDGRDFHVSDFSYPWLEFRCPSCGQQFLHHERIDVYARDKEDAQQVTCVTVEANSGLVNQSIEPDIHCPSARRSGVSITFSCEICDATPVLHIAQHKGHTIFRMESTFDKNRFAG